MSPEEAVKQAVANAALEGVELNEAFQALLLLVATGRLDADTLVAQLIDEGGSGGRRTEGSICHG